MDIGGLYAHAGQSHAQGLLAIRISALGQGIQIFADELGPEWKNTASVFSQLYGLNPSAIHTIFSELSPKI